ncbi:MAG: NERD domain-containing protein [Elusimicrobia bacterium]|nr:NERD domain-containing protein [Elusimicrobiota bacterium]
MKNKIDFVKEILRSMGQSCEWKIRENFFYLGAAAGAFIVVIILLIFKNSGGIAFALLLVSGYIFYWLLEQIKPFFLGLEGVKRTREEIEPITKDGYHIFNDVQGNKFNIDFLIIGPSGIYVIVVKNPATDGSQEIYYQDETIFLGSGPLTAPNPILEAKSRALWVKQYLQDVKGADANNIKPVVLFPKITIPRDEDCVLKDIWILNPARFRDCYLPKQEKVLNPQEVQELVSIFKAHINGSIPKFED